MDTESLLRLEEELKPYPEYKESSVEWLREISAGGKMGINELYHNNSII